MTMSRHPSFPAPASDPSGPLSGLMTAASGLPVMRMGREICSEFQALDSREWLVTNGIGGYAAGSLSGINTRGYHGLLISAQDPPVGRTLMLAGLIETVEIGGRRFPLATMRWTGGAIAPNGWTNLASVSFEGTVPTWRFECPGFEIEKSIFMDHGANVTRIDYRVVRASSPLRIGIEALTDFRDYHGRSFANRDLPRVEADSDTLRVFGPGDAATDLHLVCQGARASAETENFYNFDLAKERTRGLTDHEDHVRAGSFLREAVAGDAFQFVASAGARIAPDAKARSRAMARESEILADFRGADVAGALEISTPAQTPGGDIPAWIARLALAADQFIVRRTLRDGSPGHSVIAGYHWFADWGRDTMISLPGLTHMCGRSDIAASVLRAFADVVDGGMIPNRFTDDGGAPEYNTVDATFWFVEAIRWHWRITGDQAFLRELFPVLDRIVTGMQAGTRYGIGVAEDGLIQAGEAGVQLTWMDAKVGDWVVTPRMGKPIEVNALWIGALDFLAEAASVSGADPERFTTLAARARGAFERFWNPETGFAFDVIDGPEGDDPSLRPNQILAARAATGVFDADRRRAIVDICERELLTPAGLRSLAPGDPAYKPAFGGDQVARDGAYHQGTVWAWLIGPFIEAHLDAYGDAERAAACLAPLADQIGIEAIGTIGEIFQGDAPHAPCGCVAQAWSVAEVLRAWRLVTTREGGAR